MVFPAWPWLDTLLNWLAYGTWHLSAWQLVAFTLLMTHITIASVTIYLHRHQAHRSLDLHWLPSHFFPALAVADHRHDHQILGGDSPQAPRQMRNR